MTAHHYALVEALARAATLADGHELLHASLLDALVSMAPETAELAGLRPCATTAGLTPTTLPAHGWVRVRCLGTCRLLVDGRPAEPCRSNKALALFLYLVHNRTRTSSRDALLDALWPQGEARAPASSLHVAAHALRQYLSNLGIGRDVLALETRGSGYRLRASALWLDVEAFARARALGARLERHGHTDEALAAYTRAADLYQGDFLPDECADWATFRREALRDQYLAVLARLSELALVAGDYRACLEYCERALEHDPYGEHVYRTLVLCHGMLSQRSRARWWYERCVRVLHADLDVEPQPETVRLYARVMFGEIAAVTVPAGIQNKD